MRGRAVPPLHLVTDDRVLADPAFSRRAAAALEAGGGRVALHLRGRGMGGRRLVEVGREVMGAGGLGDGGRILVNDRVDVALILNADGAHLPGSGLPPAVARSLLGEDRFLGRSLHDSEEWTALPPPDRGALDYLLLGTLFATASHPEREGGGVEHLASLLPLVEGLPVVGIGGITPERVPLLRRGGAAGVAVLRGVWNAEDPAGAVESFLVAWDEVNFMTTEPNE